MPDGVTALVQLGNGGISSIRGTQSSATISDDDATSANLSVGLSGTDSTCNYLYELFNSTGGLITSTNSAGLSYNGLSVGSYIVKVRISKTAIPEPPKNSPSYRYRRETYYTTKT